MVYDLELASANAAHVGTQGFSDADMGVTAYADLVRAVREAVRRHTPRDAKGMLVKAKVGAGGETFKGPWGVSVSRNLTPHASGLKGWTDEQIAHSVRTGTDRENKPYKPPMAFAWYANISDADMAALVTHLRSLKPQAGGAK